jgi:cation diffusion facilitator family transporter
MKSVFHIGATSLLVSLVVLGLKYLAFHLTGSIALYSDALESIINVVTAIVALVALYVAAQPADANHPFGHTKAEYFSAVVEGVLIVIAAFTILREAYAGFLAPRLLDAPAEGLALNALATAINGFWCWYLIRAGRRLRSPALVADGRHLLTDVVTSVGVLVGLGLALATGWAVLDPALAAIVALNILWSGWGLIRESVSGLMDEAASAETIQQIREAISANADGAIEAHDVRTRHAGRTTFIEFHLVVPGDMSVQAAHDICDRLEQVLATEFEARTMIHVEPEFKAKHSGVVVL